MTLSNDLVSKFVKITNDSVKTKESTVYGTIVDKSGVKYVKIDGSDLLTPITTTADIDDGERVTVMIKNHKATVMGNISTPSASSKVVGQVVQDVGNMSNKITEVEILIADRVSTDELYAEIAKIDELIAGRATIDQLEAANATIKVLDAEVANIQTLVSGNLTSDNIASLNLTSANTTIENAMIKDAMIDSITASKIVAGSIDTGSVTIQSSDGSMVLTGSVQQFKDENGVVRIQMGKDSSGDFTFMLYDETGKGVLINESGIQSSDALADGLIVDAKVADNAAISGGKLDIESVVTEVNNSTTTIKSSKIYLDEEEQTLDVSFSAMKTATEENTDRIESNTTSLEIQNGQISTLIAENEIRQTELEDLSSATSEISTKYSLLEQEVNQFRVSVGETYATKETVNDINTNLTTNYSTTEAMTASIEMKANEISSSVSATYATKEYVDGIVVEGGISETQMNSAIQQKADEITASVSATYATKDAMNAAINLKADEITSSVSATYATIDYVDDVKVDLKENYSTTTQMNSAINQKANEITSTVSETYATKGTVNDLSQNLTTNYTTLEAMNSAINQKANEITSTVSATYATKEYVDGIVIEGGEGITEADMNSAITQKADEILSTVSTTYASKDELTSNISSVQQTADKINWVVSSGTSSSDMVLTDDAMNLISSNVSISSDQVTFTAETFQVIADNIDLSEIYIGDLVWIKRARFYYTLIGYPDDQYATEENTEYQSWSIDTGGHAQFNGGITSKRNITCDNHLYLKGVAYLDGGFMAQSGSVKDDFAVGGYINVYKIQATSDIMSDGVIYCTGFSSSASASVTTDFTVGGTTTTHNLKVTNNVVFDTAVSFPQGFSSKTSGSVTTDFSVGGYIYAYKIEASSDITTEATLYCGGLSSSANGSITSNFTVGGKTTTNTLTVNSTSTFTGAATFNNGFTSKTNGTVTQNLSVGGVVTAYRVYAADYSQTSTFYQVQCNQGMSVGGRLTAGSFYTKEGNFVGSDKKLKKNIKYVKKNKNNTEDDNVEVPNADIDTSEMLEFIENLPLASYQYTDALDQESTRYGFIVQDIENTKVGSELVHTPKDSEGNDIVGFKCYSQEQFIAFICGALQEEIKQRKELEELVNSAIKDKDKDKDKDKED